MGWGRVHVHVGSKLHGSHGMGASSIGWEQVVWNGNRSHGLETSCMGWEPVTWDVSK